MAIIVLAWCIANCIATHTLTLYDRCHTAGNVMLVSSTTRTPPSRLVIGEFPIGNEGVGSVTTSPLTTHSTQTVPSGISLSLGFDIVPTICTVAVQSSTL